MILCLILGKGTGGGKGAARAGVRGKSEDPLLTPKELKHASLSTDLCAGPHSAAGPPLLKCLKGLAFQEAV